ncbi:MAG: hypothetical protein WCP22_10190 [Chlamydiota bacterium]
MSTLNAVQAGEQEWRAGERRRRRRVLALCLAASFAAHFLVLFSFGPPWSAKPARLRPAGTRAVSLRLRPRPAGGAPSAVKAPAAVKAAQAKPAEKAAQAKPAEKAPGRRPVYGKEELSRKLSQVLSPQTAEKSAKTKEARLREILADRQIDARAWVSREADVVSGEAAQAEEGAVGYQRVIDLRKCSDFEIGRLMDQFKMEIGYGSRKVSDFNLQFTSQWLLTPGQFKNLSSRAGRAVKGKRAAMPAAGTAVVALSEPGDGPARSYLSPTVAAMAAIIAAEEDYYSSSKADPDGIERVVFSPVWSYKGPAFTVTAAEKKRQAQGTKKPEANGARERPGADGGKGKGGAR